VHVCIHLLIAFSRDLSDNKIHSISTENLAHNSFKHISMYVPEQTFCNSNNSSNNNGQSYYNNSVDENRINKRFCCILRYSGNAVQRSAKGLGKCVRYKEGPLHRSPFPYILLG